jgi:hypothetical protein
LIVGDAQYALGLETPSMNMVRESELMATVTSLEKAKYFLESFIDHQFGSLWDGISDEESIDGGQLVRTALLHEVERRKGAWFLFEELIGAIRREIDLSVPGQPISMSIGGKYFPELNAWKAGIHLHRENKYLYYPMTFPNEKETRECCAWVVDVVRAEIARAGKSFVPGEAKDFH